MLNGASLLYRAGVLARNFAYDRRMARVHSAGVPVVSVGNLTLGGTGKTPMVEWVSRWGRERGRRVAILSRGYGGTDGLNDEGRVLEENLPDVPHLQGKDRAGLAKIAVDELDSELLVLDDGFQHRRLSRDLDLVLIDALDPFGMGKLTPRGLLREPIANLKRADLVVLSRADLIDEPDRRAIKSHAERKAGPLRWLDARHSPRDVLDAEGNSEPVSTLSKVKIAAFCGIGNPSGFRRTIEPLVGSLMAFRKFPDHHPYGLHDLTDLAQWVEMAGVDLVLTTQKDLVKLRITSLGGRPLRALRIGLEPLEGADLLESALGNLFPADPG